MEALIAGYRRFHADRLPVFRDRLRELGRVGQAPKALVIACCDSRVDPQMIFDAAPGDLFVIRNIANLVPPYAPTADYHGTSAALEFAVRRLDVPDLVVMGHGKCGGIRALMEGEAGGGGDFIGPWMSIAAGVRGRACGCAHTAELEAIRLSLANLAGYPWVHERVESGRLGLHGCHFDVATGSLLRLDAADGTFREVVIYK